MRLLTITVILLLHSLSLPVSAQDVAQSTSASNLTRLLESELSRWPAKSGLYVKNLSTGETASVRGEEHFESASTIKVSIMVLAYQLADQKKLDLDERYEIKAADFRGGSGIFKYNDVGLRPTLRDVITQMIITSDNTATDIMVAKVGGRQKLNEFLRQLGYKTLNLNYTTNDYFQLRFRALDDTYKSLTPEQVFALTTDRPELITKHAAIIQQVKDKTRLARERGQRLDSAWEGEPRWFGVASPVEMGRLLEGIERCTVAAKASCEEMLRILSAQQVRHKIPHYLSVPVANKTGDTGGVTNDVAIVYAHSGPIIITSYNMNVVGVRTELDDRIGAIARRIVGYFDGAR